MIDGWRIGVVLATGMVASMVGYSTQGAASSTATPGAAPAPTASWVEHIADAGLAQLQADLALPNIETRLEELERRADQWDELADWTEATRLGIAHDLAIRNTGLNPRQEARLAATIVREARASHLDPLLVTAVIEVESGFNAYVVSRVGAVGMMQIMPKTAGWLSDDEPNRPGQLFDFERNIHLGCCYLAWLMDHFGRVDRALVAYNMGPASARRALSTQRAHDLLAGYPKKVLTQRDRLSHRLARSSDPSDAVVASVGRFERKYR